MVVGTHTLAATLLPRRAGIGRRAMRLAGIAVLALLALSGASQAADKVVLQLNGPPQFEYAGYYAAGWQGYYGDAGLTVEIKPGDPIGEPPTDPARAVAEGRAQFGVGGMGLVIRAAQGLPLMLLAPIFQRSGAEIYYRADHDYASPAALIGARLGRPPASDILDIELATALQAEGVDPAKLQSTTVMPQEAVEALAAGQVDAAVGSAWLAPWQAHERGIALKAVDPADYRVEFYGDTLFTSRNFASASPAVVRRFLQATLKGWDYAFRHSDVIADRIVTQLPVEVPVADAKGFAHFQADVARRLARYPAVPLGHSNPQRWARIEASLAASGALLRTADAADFVYGAPAATGLGDGRVLALLGGVALAILAIAGWLWRERRRRAAALGLSGASEQTEHEPALPAAIDLNALLGEIEGAIRRRLPRRAAFRLSLLPELWPCYADHEAVAAAVLDLAAAAATDLPLDGSVIIGTRNYPIDAAAAAELRGPVPGDYVRVTVRDNGPGLSETGFEQIYDPALTARPAIVRAARMMRRLDAFIRTETAEGVGTAVHLYFQRAATAAINPRAAADSARAKAAE